LSPNQTGGAFNDGSIIKAQYTKNIGSTAFVRLFGYSFYSDRIDNGIVGEFQNYVSAFSPDYKIRSHTRGVTALFADQIDPHNLLSFDAAYSYSNTTRDRNDTAAGSGFAPIAYLVNSLDPTGGCFNGTGAAVGCRGAAQYRLPATIGAPAGLAGKDAARHLVATALTDAFVLLIPLSIGIAILKHRLFDIDLIVNRTLVYGALTALVIGGYVLIGVVLFGIFRITGDRDVWFQFIATLVGSLFGGVAVPLGDDLNHGR